jgi:hypothetical protein
METNSSQIDHYSLDDLKELAIEADIYVNESSSPSVASQRSVEIMGLLNETAEGLYTAQQVSIFGIYKAAKPVMTPEGLWASRTYLEKGALTGLASGFMVVDYETHFKDVLAVDKEQYNDLYLQLRERSLGRYGVSHLLLLGERPLQSRDLLHQAINHYGALAPIATSSLFVDGDEAYVPPEKIEAYKYQEGRRTIESADPLIRSFMGELETKLLESDDPLTSLASVAKDFRRVSNNVNEALRIAMTRRIKEVVLDSIAGAVYRFEKGMPLSLLKSPKSTNATPCTFSPEAPYVIYLREIGRAPYYQDAAKPHDVKYDDQEALYVTGSFIADGYVMDDTFFIPLEHISNYDYTLVEA